MSLMQNDQKILKLITQVFVDIFNLTNIWNLPDQHNAIINFAGRNMQVVINDNQEINYNKLERKSIFSIDELSALVLKLVLHVLQIGRYVNIMRTKAGKQTIDWYQRSIEEDNRERVNQKIEGNECTTEDEA